MLDIARAAIQQRAVRDGYEPEAYDARRDPEGYVISLLNALHQWCHHHALDWKESLVMAQGFFEQDICECEPDAAGAPPPEVKDLRCPNCGQEDAFFIEVSEYLLMFKEGIALHGDAGEQWDDRSYCRCHACGRPGTVYQFRKTSQAGKDGGPDG
jgi:ribosomal protein S14